MKLRDLESAVPVHVVGIAKKSITELLRGLSYKTIYQALRHGSVLAGASFNIAYIPDDGPEAADPLKFDPMERERRYQIGQALGRSGRLGTLSRRGSKSGRIRPSRQSSNLIKQVTIAPAIRSPCASEAARAGRKFGEELKFLPR